MTSTLSLVVKVTHRQMQHKKLQGLVQLSIQTMKEMCSYSKITGTNLKLYLPYRHSLANGFIVSVVIENHILHNAAILY